MIVSKVEHHGVARLFDRDLKENGICLLDHEWHIGADRRTHRIVHSPKYPINDCRLQREDHTKNKAKPRLHREKTESQRGSH